MTDPTWLDPTFQPHPTVAPPTGPPPGWAPAVGDETESAVAAAPPATRRLAVVELLVVLFVVAVPSFIFGLQGIGDPQTVETELSLVEFLTQFTAGLGPGALAIYLLWRDGLLGVAGFGRRGIGFVVGYAAIGLVCCFIALFTMGLVIFAVQGLPEDGEETSILDEGDDTALTLRTMSVAVGISVAAGVAEEALFRAYATTRLEQAGLRRAAVWAPLLVFASLHLYQGLVAFFVVGAVGAVFTWLYRWKRSVYPAMLAHVLYDVGIFALALSAGSGAG